MSSVEKDTQSKERTGTAFNRREFIRAAGVGSLVVLAAGLNAQTDAQAVLPGAELSLSGTWEFALDAGDVGVQAQWFGHALPDKIALPGILQTQGFGDPVSVQTPWVISLYDRYWYLRKEYQDYTKPGSVQVPFLCQPPRHYLGAAWYGREVSVPEAWRGRRVVLTLERPHWGSTVWLDGQRVGAQNSLCAPHVHDLGVLTPGAHRVSIRVDNRLLLPYRPDSHSVSDSEGGSWNGIAGKITLSSTSPVWIDDAQVFPDVARKAANIVVQIGTITKQTGSGTLSAGSVNIPVTWTAAGGTARITVPLGGDAQTWDEFHPVLHTLALTLSGGGADDRRTVTFGLRELRAQGQAFLLNGGPIQFRGTHNAGDFPLTGYPATDITSWTRIIKVCQSYGLNHMRFHSWCPPEAAFAAADALGFYFQVECGMWNPFSPGSPIEAMLYAETERIVKAYGNHPSFLLLSASNEPAGAWARVLPQWVAHWKDLDPRRLYTTGTGRDAPETVSGSQYVALGHSSGGSMRGVDGWFGQDYRQGTAALPLPSVAHELGQWCAYPDFSIIKKFTGYMRPGNYEIFRDSLAAHGMLAKNKEFALASGRFQVACYKEEIEANLRTPGFSGFQLLDLHDYVGQGTALVGVLDTFWDSKGYATPAAFRRFCSQTVPLARMNTRIFTSADTFSIDVELAHAGAAPLANIAAEWRILDHAGKRVAQGQWPARAVPVGKNIALGTVNSDLSKLLAPGAYRLEVALPGTDAANDWNFWLYPAQVPDTPNSDILVTHSWDAAQAKLAAGGTALFLPRASDLGWNSPPLARIPVFWNRLMGPGWSRMLGLWCDTAHPALAEFPTEAHCDWQWTDLVRTARAINLDSLPGALQPIVQPIDDWNRNYKLGLLFECRVGKGRLMVSSLDLETALETRPVARQLRRSVLRYMASRQFQPKVAVSAAQMESVLFDTRIMRKLGAAAQGSAANAIDGDPNTFWLSQGGFPHELTLAFPSAVPMAGMILMPRQNDRDHVGDIQNYAVQVSDDGNTWRDAMRGTLASTFSPQTVHFPQTQTARYLKFIAISGYGPSGAAALAELAVLYAGPKLPDDGTDTVIYQPSRSTTTEIDEGPAAPPTAPTPGGQRPR